MMRTTMLFAVGLAGCLLAHAATAADPTYARSLAATCFTCHGTDGRSVDGVEYYRAFQWWRLAAIVEGVK